MVKIESWKYTISKFLFKDVINVYEENTFNLNETIHGAYYKNVNILDNNTEVLRYIFGKGYMFWSPRNLLAVHELDGITFKLNPNASYSLAVHDPKYFILTGRPLVFPGIFRRYLPDVSTLSTTWRNYIRRPNKQTWAQISAWALSVSAR